MTTPDIILSQGWYLSKNPESGTIQFHMPEMRADTNAKFKKFQEDQDVWLRETSDTIYVLDWQSNARVLYEKHMENCNCPNECVMTIPPDLMDFVMLTLQDTRQIMDKIC